MPEEEQDSGDVIIVSEEPDLSVKVDEIAPHYSGAIDSALLNPRRTPDLLQLVHPSCHSLRSEQRVPKVALYMAGGHSTKPRGIDLVCPHPSCLRAPGQAYKSRAGNSFYRFCYKEQGQKEHPVGCMALIRQSLYKDILANADQIWEESKSLYGGKGSTASEDLKDARAQAILRAKEARKTQM